MQFVVLIAFGYDASTGLEPEFVVPAHEGPDGDGLVEFAVQSDKADASAVGSAVMRLDFTDEDTIKSKIKRKRSLHWSISVSLRPKSVFMYST